LLIEKTANLPTTVHKTCFACHQAVQARPLSHPLRTLSAR
jgi:hypothetical protein